MTTPHRATARQMLAVGIDVGGTKIAAGIVSGQGKVLAMASCPTPTSDRKAFLHDTVVAVRSAMADAGLLPKPHPLAEYPHLAGAGVGLPAVIDPPGRKVLWAPNIPALNGVELADLLEQELGLPVTLAYDGHTATLAEHWVGEGQNVRNMVVLIIGTGIGGGIVADGRLVRGAHGLAGAFGWMNLAFSANGPDPDADAARLGWFESRAAGPAILSIARERGGFTSTEEVFNRAVSGDAAAQRVLRQIGLLLGAAASNLVSALDTEMVVLTGGVGAHGQLLVPYVHRQIATWSQPSVRPDVRVEVSKLGASAGSIGAARLVLQ